jgi:hypothetical protein
VKSQGVDVADEARSWITAVEFAAAAKAGKPLEGLAADACEALGVLAMFRGRALAQGRTEAAEEFLLRLAPHLCPMLTLTGLSLDDLRTLRPAGVA